MRLFSASTYFCFAILVLLTACSVSKDPQHVALRHIHRSHPAATDTSFVYALPYPVGKKHMMVQGYYSRFSHRSRVAVDFKMPRGSKIAAARDGVVVRTEWRHNQGGLNSKYRRFANYIVIRHDDGSQAGYWHLKQNGVFVAVGDTVKQGQVIGLSGKTGYSAFPHLHFSVWTTGSGKWQQLPTRFHTKRGALYLKPMRSYTSIAPPVAQEGLATAEE